MHRVFIFTSRATFWGASLVFSASLALANAELAEPMPADVGVGTSEAGGPLYTTSEGMTLYSTSLDKTASGTPRCSNAHFETGVHHLGESYKLSTAQLGLQKTCLERWPAFIPSDDAKSVGKWTIIDRSEGFEQWAYNGRPLYTSIKDEFPGEVNGSAGGYGRRGGWSTVQISLGFPPGIKLVRTVDGLVLATGIDQLLFAANIEASEVSAGWAPVQAPDLAVSSGDWKPVMRPDGSRQWSYKNQTLYLTGKDMTMESIRAAVAEEVMQPILYQRAQGAPAAFQMQYSIAGWVYTNDQGKTLYVFNCSDQTPIRMSCDEIGDPAIYRSSICGSGEDCAREWRPVLAAADAVKVGEWDVREVPDPPFSDAAGAYGENVPMVRAWTYRGKPLYTFAGDHNPGDINGHTVRYYGVSSFNAVKVLGNSHGDGERFFAND